MILHNATVHTVAAREPPFQKREIGDSCATDCYRAMYCQCCGTDVYGDVCQSCIDAIQAIKAIERFGGSGLIVSVAFGPCGNNGDLYSVTVMDPDTGKEFEQPFGASDFGTIAEILDKEVPAMLAR